MPNIDSSKPLFALSKPEDPAVQRFDSRFLITQALSDREIPHYEHQLHGTATIVRAFK